MKMSKKEISLLVTVGVLISGFVYVSYLLSTETHAKIAMQNDLSATWENYQESLSRENTLYEDSVVDERTIENLQTALDTALSETALIQTLLNMEMENWTTEDILRMRSELSSLPVGSPFLGGYHITGDFGSTELKSFWDETGHKGIDLFPKSGNLNEPIISPIDGKVVSWVRNDRIYGNTLTIESMDGKYQLFFAHLDSIAIFTDNGIKLEEGLEFKAGTRIAKMGNTGKTSGIYGNHLHLEYHLLELDGSWRILNANAIIKYLGKEDK